MQFFRQKCDQKSVGRTGGQTLLHVQLQYIFLVAKDSYSYYVTLVWFSHVALWDISLYLVE